VNGDKETIDLANLSSDALSLFTIQLQESISFGSKKINQGPYLQAKHWNKEDPQCIDFITPEGEKIKVKYSKFVVKESSASEYESVNDD
jgi:hypothetical protein